MIQLCKLNNEEILINEDQVESITSIPETKIIMMNREFYLVKESGREVIDKIVKFKQRILQQ